MVVSVNTELYPSFHQSMIPEDGHQSSEDGSGLHSPDFGAFPAPHSDSLRYQHDPADIHAAGLLSSQFDFRSPLNVQQTPLIVTALDLSRASAHPLTYPSHFPPSPRNQHALEFLVQSPANSSRLSPSAHVGGPIQFRYNLPSERRLPSGPSHDLYPRPTGSAAGVNQDVDRGPPPMPSAERTEPSGGSVASTSRESRKEISTVVIACRPCRFRKIRCDSTRPVCNNCVRRSDTCEYDAVPKRRGPDKRPGTRQRSCKKRPADGSAPPPPKRKRNTADRPPDRESAVSKVKENMASGQRSPGPTHRHSERSQDTHGQPIHGHPSPTELRITTDAVGAIKHDQSPTSRRYPTSVYPQTSSVKSSFPRQLDVNVLQTTGFPHHKFPLPSSPTVESNQRSWWDNFLRDYNLQDIVDNITFLFTDTGHWLSFLNLEYFVKNLWNEESRLRIQPAFILAGLAMSTLMKSSNSAFVDEERKTAIFLRNMAQQALENAWTSSGWVDASLAEAALILALFESSLHPEYSHQRFATSLRLLDDMVRNMGLSNIDNNDQEVALFSARAVPAVHVNSSPHDRTCACFPPDAAQKPNDTMAWSYFLPWDSSWSDTQIRDEECRRLCWSALSLISGFTSQSAAFNKESPNFFLTDPSNFALLFPGEVMDRMSPSYLSTDSPSTKESVWALYCRSMLLWNFCARLRIDNYSEEDKSEHAAEAWMETQSLLNSLAMHQCNLDTSLLYLTREYILNTRMIITQVLRDLQGLDNGIVNSPGPMFNAKQIAEWMVHQKLIIKSVTESVHQTVNLQDHQLARRPYQGVWFVNQLRICLEIWERTELRIDLLDLAKAILWLVEVMNALWPCESYQRECEELRQRLTKACSKARIDSPISDNYPRPPLMRTG